MGNIFGITLKEAWSIIHGVVLGGGLLLLFPIVIAGLLLLGGRTVNEKRYGVFIRCLICIAWMKTLFGWLVNIVGTFIPYPWYRVPPPEGQTDLLHFPRSYLLSFPHLAVWENIGMHWKEHLGWFTPILCTSASYVLSVYAKSLEDKTNIRRAIVALFFTAFVTAGITGVIGIFITKLAPVR